MEIGIIGLGYVGKALEAYFKEFYQINTFDINGKSSCSSLDQVVSKSEVIFICVPTPMKKDRSTDLSIIESVISQINNVVGDNSSKLIVIKSTIPVGTTNKFTEKFNKIKICFNPEFLTEANFIDDFKNQKRIILGGDNINILYQLYSQTFNNIEIIKTNAQTAEMVKYVTNTFLATKVSYANEIATFCSHLDIDYNKMIEIAALDERLGSSHWMVPGPDGSKGFGGSCFPKDLSSLVYQFEQHQILSIILKAVLERNENFDRTQHDWKKLIGRAVSEQL